MNKTLKGLKKYYSVPKLTNKSFEKYVFKMISTKNLQILKEILTKKEKNKLVKNEQKKKKRKGYGSFIAMHMMISSINKSKRLTNLETRS
jgi:hypothetical protein